MKKLFVSIAAILLAVNVMAGVDFTKADALLNSDVAQSRQILVSMLDNAAPGAEKASVLWRLSRICLIEGQNEATKEGKRNVFGQGIKYAEEAIKENPKEPQAYMWHSANVGRECQTRSIMEQSKKVSVMMNDLSFILDKLGKTDCSEAWQALAEIYYNHPFKSNDAAANYVRQAALTIPGGEMRLSSYVLLARILSERGWSAQKRASEATKNSSAFSAANSSNIDRYVYLDGAFSKSSNFVWSNKPYTSMSDIDEARALIDYSIQLYTKTQNRTSTDKADYKAAVELKNKIK